MNNVVWKILSYNNDTSQYEEEVLEGVCMPVKGSDKLNQEFNVAEIDIDTSENGNRFPKYLKMCMYVNDILEREYVVEQDIVTLVSFGDLTHPKLYQHQIILMEQTKLLEAKLLPNVSFSYYKPFAKAISTYEDLVAINDDTSGSYYLTNDIDCNYEDFTSIETFSGIFDGKGYEIKNCNVIFRTYSPSSNTTFGYGFFNNLYGATIINITFTNILCLYFHLIDYWVWKNTFCIGSLFGTADKDTIISNTHIEATVEMYANPDTVSTTADRQTFKLGGFGGECNGTIVNSSSIANDFYLVTKSVHLQNKVAGEDIAISGFVNVTNTSNISNCYSRHGLYIESTSPSLYFAELYASGFASTLDNTISPKIKKCYSAQTLYTNLEGHLADGDRDMFSIANNANIEDCYAQTNINFEVCQSASEKTELEMKTQSTYIDWDFENTWTIDETINNGYPYLLPNIIFVNDRQYSIKDMIQRLINLSDIRVHNSTTGITQSTKFIMSQELINKLDGNEKYIRSPEMYFHNLNLWECLWQLGGYLNAIPFLQNVNEINYYWLNENTQEKIDISYVAENKTQTGTQYATDTVSYVDNLAISPSKDISGKIIGTTDATSTNIETVLVVYPSLDSWATPRSLGEVNSRINNDNSAIQLPKGFEIYTLHSAYMKIGNNVYDITNYIYEKSAYNALPDTSTGKGLALIYDQFGTKIYGFSNQPIEGFVPEYPALRNIMIKLNGSAIPFKDAQFRIIYQAKINTINRAIKENNDDFEYEATSVINQDENLISSENFTSNQQNKLNQLANIDATKGYEIDNFSDLPQIGDYVDGYFINQVDWEIYPYVVRYNISYTKDFNRRSEFIGVNRKRRPFPVPADLLIDSRRDISEYVVFDTIQPTTVSNSHLTSIGEESIINSPFQDGYNKIHNVNMITGNYSPVDIENPTMPISDLILSTVSYPSVTGLNFHTEFLSNVSAGAKSVYIDVNNSYNTQVLYTKDGFCDYLSPRYIDYYPSTTETLANQLPQRDTNIPLDDKIYIDYGNDRINIYKDSREILKFIYHLLYIKEDNNIIIGNSIIDRNSMIGGINTNNYKILLSKNILNRYISNIDIDNINIIEATGATLARYYDNTYKYGTYSIVIPETTDIYKSFVVVDDDNNIIFGYNGTIDIGTTQLTPIYIYFRDNDYRNKK